MDKAERANPLIFILVCVFGSSAWLGSYASWVEMGVFTQRLPEGWQLGSITTVAIQIASIGPIIFMLVDRCTQIPVPRGRFIQVALIVCALCNIPLALFWEKTIWIFGHEHSLTVILMAFIIGSINVSSEVIFMPYMIEFKHVYLPAYFIGVGLSACIPSLVSIVQGASDYSCVWNNETLQFDQTFVEARFSVTTFYFIMFAWMCVTCLSFYLINSHATIIENLNCFGSKELTSRSTSNTIISVNANSLNVDGIEQNTDRNVNLSDEDAQLKKPNRFRDTCILLCLAIVGFSLNTLIPSIQSYAALPYSQRTYFWSLILSSLAQPVGAFVSFFIHPRRTYWLILLTSICISCTIFIVYIASQSPMPILKYSIFGSILIISLEIIVYAVGFLLRTALLECYRDDGPNEQKREFRLFFGGLITQAGTLVGTLVIFPLINVFQVFKDAPPC